MKFSQTCFLGLLLFCWCGYGAPNPVPLPQTLTLDASKNETLTRDVHFLMGGTNAAGIALNANNQYFTLDGHPWFPVMGEFHFSRYPASQWEHELLKMKAGGISVVSTYVFWNYHEEVLGKFNWSGNRDLRRFVQLCAKHGLYCMIRLGPWSHGEARNGGFSDWLETVCKGKTRQHADPYLIFVQQYFDQIGRQCRGLLWEDGGPIIGVQVENELTGNAAHLLELKQMARKAGFDTPLYTATGWGGTQLPRQELLPVFGGYPDAFWDEDIVEWAPHRVVHYFFNLQRDDSNIGADLRPIRGVSATQYLDAFPFSTCELGGGMQVSYHRRPQISPEDAPALALVKLGSGSVMQGYYMYHGGSHATDGRTPLNESRASGYPNDLPVVSYDFQTALGEYGQRGPSYDGLRVQHLFLNDFGADLATLPATLPDQLPEGLEDTRTVRWSVRSDGTRGYLFVNNYQRLRPAGEKANVRFDIQLREGSMKIPAAPVTIPQGASFIWPFNMNLNGATLRHATAQPLCRVGNTVVFFAINGIEPEFVFDTETLAPGGIAIVKQLNPGLDCLFTVKSRAGTSTSILVLRQDQALRSYKANIWGADRLFISAASLVFDARTVALDARRMEDFEFSVYPDAGIRLPGKKGSVFARYTAPPPVTPIPPLDFYQTRIAAPARSASLDLGGMMRMPVDADFDKAAVYHLDIPAAAFKQNSELFLKVHYVGDVARLYLNGKLIADNFYNGSTWEIGLKRFASPALLKQGLELKILPLHKDYPIMIPRASRPVFDSNGEALTLDSVTLEPEYEVIVRP